MQRTRTNILVCGLLKTGSSALVDLLREYDNIHVVPGEFDDFRAPGLVADQLSERPEVAIANFIEQYTKWRNRLKLTYRYVPLLHWELQPVANLRRRLETVFIRLRQLHLLKRLNDRIRSARTLEEKLACAESWIRDVGSINSRGRELVVFNQPIYLAVEDVVWSRVFRPWKLIIAIRNPRDQFADIIRQGVLFAPFGAPYMNHGGGTLEAIYGRSRKGAIALHIDAVRKSYEWIDALWRKYGSESILVVDFDELVLAHDVCRSRIEQFLGCAVSNHLKRRRYFDPKQAAEAVGMHDRYLSHADEDAVRVLEAWYSRAVKRTRENQPDAMTPRDVE